MSKSAFETPLQKVEMEKPHLITIEAKMSIIVPEGTNLVLDYNGYGCRLEMADGREVNFWPYAEVIDGDDGSPVNLIHTHEMEKVLGFTFVEYDGSTLGMQEIEEENVDVNAASGK